MNSLLVVANDEAWRFSYFPSFGFSAEFGDVANFSDDLDEELIDIIAGSSSTNDSVSEVLERFNTTLLEKYRRIRTAITHIGASL